ncbi:MAG TPA: sulfite exporter TauE/SafE family protein [Microbacteriaceae bacterium]|nr:sulfite exporter TauE/SafE family protein [Microbacteriaceae bacterium]
MDIQFIIMLTLALVVGISLGLLGGGGSILTVPILTYVGGMDPKVAIASSLFIVGVTSIGGLISHARGGRVQWKTGIIFGLAGMVGAYLGGFVGGYIPGVILMVLFAIMMLATAIAMIRGRKKVKTATDDKKQGLPLFRVILDGALVGLATGLVGAGGGFLIVPALNLLGGLPIAVAIGTSLLVIVMKSFAGFAGYLNKVAVDWTILLSFSAVAIVGSFIGAKLAGKIPEQKLRKGFGYFVLVMGAFVIFQEAPQLIELFTQGA